MRRPRSLSEVSIFSGFRDEENEHNHKTKASNSRFLKFFLWISVLFGLSFMIAFVAVLSVRHDDHTRKQQPSKPTFQPTFQIKGGDFFYRNGKPFRIISGSFHYFRVHPSDWDDRFTKLKALKLNTIQTHVPWNLHEPEPKQWKWCGLSDLNRFLSLAKSYGFHVNLRAGPYASSELDFGGLPYWLLKNNSDIRLRSTDPTFLIPMDRWFAELFTVVRPHLFVNGGSIIMVQLEHEYGSQKERDPAYLKHIYNTSRHHLGNNVILYSSDGAVGMINTHVEGVYQTMNFLATPNIASEYKLFREVEKNGPFMNSEYHLGRPTFWGNETFAPMNSNDLGNNLDILLATNASVNLYIAVGGTSFGFMSGSLGYHKHFYPVITSYDNGAPISEAGALTEKYSVIRKVISKYTDTPLPDPPVPSSTLNQRTRISITHYTDIFGIMIFLHEGESVSSDMPLTMEDLSQDSGYLLYIYNGLLTRNTTYNLSLPRLHDRATIFNGRESIGVISRDASSTAQTVLLDIKDFDADLRILVENQGRLSYGLDLKDFKGLLGGVYDTESKTFLKKWSHTRLPMSTERLQNIPFNLLDESFNSQNLSSPYFFKGYFSTDIISDMYINMIGWDKGFVLINGFNVGRYWVSRGPQSTLFVSAGLLLEGVNKIIIFEEHKAPLDRLVYLDRKETSE